MPPVRSVQPAISQPAASRSLLSPRVVTLPSIAVPIADIMADTDPVVVPPVVQHGLPQGLPRASSAFEDLPRPGRFRSGRKRPIDVFVDSTADPVPQGPRTQRPRLDGRVPLSRRSDSANSTPTPSPRCDTAPFSQSPNDSFWTGQENQDPSPPTTPEAFFATFPSNTTTPNGPPPQARVTRPARLYALPRPRNFVLYELLGLDGWKVSNNQILSAWRRASLQAHPDRVPEEDRDVATMHMQQINAAKEILTDRAARRAYHRTGALPMAM